MQPRHIALALTLALFWGFNFVVIKVGLDGVPPLLLAALRFGLAGLPCLFLPRPAMPWTTLVMVALTLFVLQFALLFEGMTVGLPPGLASIGLQVQAFITILFTALLIGETPTPRQMAGGAVAFLGLALIGATVGTNGVTIAGFLLMLGAASCWAAGNVMLRRTRHVDLLALVSWASLVAAGPLLLLSLAFEGPARIAAAVSHPSWLAVGAVVYLAFVGTTFGYAVWGHLMRLYPPAVAAPFSLLVPVFGTLSAALFLGETFGPVRFLGMALILAGLAVSALPWDRILARRGAGGAGRLPPA